LITCVAANVSDCDEVHDGHHGGEFGVQHEEHAKGKPMDNGTPKCLPDNRKLQRSFLDADERRSNSLHEIVAEAVPFSLIPEHRLSYVQFRFRPDLETNH